MKRFLSICFLISSLFSYSQSNSYTTVVGIKGGFPGYGSINAKHNLGGSKFIEASMGGLSRGTYGNGFYLLGDFEINNPLKDGFLWYYGAGGMLGVSSFANSSYLHVAPNAVAGIEYVFEDLPLNISLETGPYVFITPNIGFVWGGGLALRYVVK